MWPWPFTLGHQFQSGSRQYGKQPFSENRVQIGSFVRFEFCLQAEQDTQTHTDKLKWRYNPSTMYNPQIKGERLEYKNQG